MTGDSVPPALRSVLNPIAAEGVESVREQLVLWLIRSRYDIGAADSYAYILADRELFDGVQVDAVFVITRRDLVTPVYVLYADEPRELENLVAALADALTSEDAPEARLASTDAHLRAVFELAADRRIASDVSRLILGICRTEAKQAQQQRIVDAAEGVADVEVVDESFVLALAEADARPTALMPDVLVRVDPSAVLDLGIPQTQSLVTSVEVEQVAAWPGIADRTLFDLNVRFGLGLNRVRRSLDEALQSSASSEQFILYHNGLTAICSDFEITPHGIRASGLSVVNGAQTVVAIHANRYRLAPGLRLVLKLVKAEPDSELARNIAIRSNTQNPVTSRNLRALDEVQERLQRDLGRLGYVYNRRQNEKSTTGHVIRNDDVAQLLCSIYVRKPAVAVKRQVLFENQMYNEIFPSDIDASRVVFATLLREEVEAGKARVPEVYQRAWALTALTLVNMTAEAMRDDPRANEILLSPSEAIKDPLQTRAAIAPFVSAACSVLQQRDAIAEARQLSDDFRIAFKQTRTLNELALATSKEVRNAQRNGAL